MSEFIEVSEELSNRGNPKQVKKKCEWTGDYFWVDWKYRDARFKDTDAMYEWRKSKNREIVKCKNCGEDFERYKNITHYRSGKLQQYCSNECNRTSKEKREKLRKWANSSKNQFNKKSVQEKVKKTKLKRYGSETYNNIEQAMETNIKKYGTPLPMIKSSNGKTISKGQRRLFETIKKEHEDAKLEYFLEDVGKSVDIFIPNENKVIEYFGDYWHCNPKKYDKDYYHTQVHKTAKEIWQHDDNRISELKSYGYDVEIIWESDLK